MKHIEGLHTQRKVRHGVAHNSTENEKRLCSYREAASHAETDANLAQSVQDDKASLVESPEAAVGSTVVIQQDRQRWVWVLDMLNQHLLPMTLATTNQELPVLRTERPRVIDWTCFVEITPHVQ